MSFHESSAVSMSAKSVAMFHEQGILSMGHVAAHTIPRATQPPTSSATASLVTQLSKIAWVKTFVAAIGIPGGYAGLAFFESKKRRLGMKGAGHKGTVATVRMPMMGCAFRIISMREWSVNNWPN